MAGAALVVDVVEADPVLVELPVLVADPVLVAEESVLSGEAPEDPVGAAAVESSEPVPVPEAALSLPLLLGEPVAWGVPWEVTK